MRLENSCDLALGRWGYIDPEVDLEGAMKSAKQRFREIEQRVDVLIPVGVMHKWIRDIRRAYEELELPSLEVVKLMKKLEIRNASFLYRVQGGGFDELSLTLLREHALSWLGEHSFSEYFVDEVSGEVNLSGHQSRALEAASSYPLFVKLLVEDKKLLERFFKWALIDNCPVEPFIEFYKTCNKIRKSNLHKRIGYFSGDVLRIELGSYGRKVLTLPFEVIRGRSQRIPVQSDQTIVRFSNGTEMTMGEIFRVFVQKKVTPGDLEMMNGVIKPWNYFESLWKIAQKAVPENDWWEQIPDFEVLTLEQIREKYGLEETVDPGQWIRVIRSNRESSTMDIAGTHGFFEYLIPRGDGTYRVLPFTFIATQFTTGWEKWPIIDISLKILRLAKTERGRWATDETPFYSQRPQAAFPKVVSEEDGRRHMELLRLDILNAYEGNEEFQLTVKNCAFSAMSQIQRAYFREKIPDIFTTSMLDNTPREPLGRFFKWVKRQPPFVARLIFWFFGIVFGAWKGIFIRRDNRLEYVSVMGTPFYRDWNTANAAQLFEKIRRKEVPGKTWFSHIHK